jgi:PAS domain S-box-containing protein
VFGISYHARRDWAKLPLQLTGMPIRLTKRQLAVFELLGNGFTQREVSFKLKISEADVAEVWSEITVRIQSGEAVSLADFGLVATYDRLERQRLEAELWASEARLTALMDTAPEAVFLIDGRSGRILKVNNRALMLLGYSPRELLHQPMEMLIAENLRAKHVGLRNGFLGSVRKREMGYHPPITALTKSGETIELDIALTATASTDDVMVVCNLVGSPRKTLASHGEDESQAGG